MVEGVELTDLARGVGHYPDTARPGAVGNFAVAGHRATNGEPFADLDRVREGDVVVAETRRRWFTYVIDRTRDRPARLDLGARPGAGQARCDADRQLLTLTTCNPRWASYERLIVFGHLQGSRAKADGPPDVLVQAEERPDVRLDLAAPARPVAGAARLLALRARGGRGAAAVHHGVPLGRGLAALPEVTVDQ